MKHPLIICFCLLLFTTKTHSQITTHSLSYGVFGSNMTFSDLQYQFECSERLDISRLSSGIKWRYFSDEISGLNVEGFSRFYFGKKEKTFALNNRWYVQAKIGYGILKINADEFTQNLAVNEKYNLTALYGYGLGYKFLINERITFDLFLGKHFQKFPGSGSSIEAIRQYQTNRWNSSIGEPIEFQWSLGFQLY